MHYPVVGTWSDEWHGLHVHTPIEMDDGNAFQRFFHSALHASFLGKRYHVSKNPRKSYKDAVYILINIPWLPFTIWVLVFSILVTIFFALFFHYVCYDTDTFEDAFNLSYQSYATIGFGILYPRNTCGNYFLSLEAFSAMILISAISGLVFVRFSRPRSTAVFSNQCVIQPYGKHLALVIRVANATRSRELHHDAILEASFHMNLIRIEQRTANDPSLVMRRYVLPMLQSNFLAFRKDIQLAHIIDENSPLFGLTEENGKLSDLAIQVDVVGVDATTQSTMQDQTLYTAQDFVWGVRFEDMFQVEGNRLVMDFQKLNVTTPWTASKRPTLTESSDIQGSSISSARQSTYAARKQFSMADMMNQTIASQDNLYIDDLQVPSSPNEEHHIDIPMERVFGTRWNNQNTDQLTRSLLEQEASQSFRRSSLVSSAAHVEDAPRYDCVTPLNCPLPYSFHSFYSDALKMSWGKILLANIAAFVVINVIFALLYYIQIDGIYLYDDVRDNNTSFELCLFYSVQTLSTVGYGAVGPKPSSMYQNFLIMVESTLGIIFVTIFTGISWAKFSRARAHIQFSDRVVVTRINGQRVMMLRALNLRTHGEISGNSFRIGVTEKDKQTGLRQVHEVQLVNATFPSINVPATLIHIIDSKSPFSKFRTDHDFLECNMQMICLYSGVDHTFSSNVYARKTYYSQDIQVDRMFTECTNFTTTGAIVDYEKFQSTEPDFIY